MRLLDIGCGWEARFIKEISPHVTEAIGVDFKAPHIKSEKIKTLSAVITKKLPFNDNSFDVVTLLAVLEHLQYPELILEEIKRILRPGGIIIGTVPSSLAKPVLEFLAFKIRIVNPDEIRDHKRYYMRRSLTSALAVAGFITIRHAYFQCYMNNFFTAQKPRARQGAF